MNTMQQMYVRKASAGSGKTFTLAAHYIALLLHGERFQSILAVTFTNKATAEMKERILGYLYSIGYQWSESATQGFIARVREISTELGFDVAALTDDYCQRQAQTQHALILAHYDEMRVQTIDTFLQTLLAGMVQKLNGAVGYQIELDTQRVISDAVDELIAQTQPGTNTFKALTRYMDEQMADEKHWDIRRGLCEIGNELYKESLQSCYHQLVFDEEALMLLRQRVNWRKNAPITALQTALKAASRWTPEDFKYGKTDVVGKINTWTKQLAGQINSDSNAFVGFGARLMNDVQAAYKGTEDKAQIETEITQLQQLVQQCRTAYLRDNYRTRYINDLILMGALQERIQTHLDETNTRLLATTANTLAQALLPGDADFILEKAGIQYKHIMLDEFQDTSQLQWANFEKLLQELLASTAGSTLIVGDIKQSIYRWRNGDWTIMRDLPTQWADYYNSQTPQLVCNYRSHKEVVRFNLDTMRALTAHEQDDIRQLYDEGYDGTNLDAYYRHSKEGGYVQVRCYAQCATPADIRHQVRTNILHDMFSTIEELLAQGVSPSDIMILFRTNDEAQELLNALERPLPFVATNCFQLQFSPLVQLLVSAIRVIYTADGASAAYVQQFAPQVDLDTQSAQLQTMTLTDLTEWLIQNCILATEQPMSELCYINTFRDIVRNYVLSHDSDGITFLQYWDNILCEKTIPAVDIQGIRLMTIHAAKGLEAAHVFIPFCNWSMEADKRGSKLWCEVDELTTADGQKAVLPIPQNAAMVEAGFAEEYAAEHHMQRVDNLNLLYVALTRAAEQLYVYADVTSCAKKDRTEWNVGQLLADRCGLLADVEQMIKDKQYGDSTHFVEFHTSLTNSESHTPSAQRSILHQRSGLTSNPNPLSFQAAEEVTSSCYSSSQRIEFRQSQDSYKYGWDIASMEQDENIDQRALGNICHDILATIRLYDSVETAVQAVQDAVQRAYDSGVIPSEMVHEHVYTLLTDTIRHLSSFFTGQWYVQCEETILLRNDHDIVEERRMDRVLWTQDRQKAIVIDYKFGQDDSKYDKQVRHYMSICRRMGAKQVEGYLWLAAQQQLDPVK